MDYDDYVRWSEEQEEVWLQAYLAYLIKKYGEALVDQWLGA